MPTLNERIIQMEQEIKDLKAKMADFSKNTEESYHKPISVVGGARDRSATHATDISTGLGQMFGGPILWNNVELVIPRYGVEPATPIKGFNKHTHTRFSGGALIVDALEFVEYTSGITNKHCQGFLTTDPVIAEEDGVEKIGLLDLVFNPDTGKWGTTAYEIDIKKCNFVERDSSGAIVHSAPLYNEDTTKNSIVWDENAGGWRLLAVYASGA